jgi:hypothetical protein
MKNAERRTQNAERRTQNAERRTHERRALIPSNWALFMSGITMIGLLTMCSKDRTEPVSATQPANGLAAQIIAFKTKATSSERPKSTTTYEQDEALWLVEAALNHESIDAEARYDEMKTISYEEEATLQADGRVSEEDLFDVYYALKQAFQAEPMEEGDKLMVVDVVAKLEGGLVKFVAHYIVGKDGPPGTSALNTNFSGTYRCRNGAYSPFAPCMERNGAMAIQNRINWVLPPYTSNYILTNVEVWRVWDVDPFAASNPRITQADLPNKLLPAIQFPYANDPAPGSGYDDHMTFTTNYCPGQSFDCEPCLGPADMTRITQNAWDLFEQVRVNYGSMPGLQKIACGVSGYQYTLAGSQQNGDQRFCHNVSYVFGKWVPANDL